MVLSEIFAFLMVALGIVANIPQIVKIIKTKSAADISIFTYVLISLSCIFGVLYCYLGEFNVWMLANNASCLGLCLIVLCLCFKYK